MKLKHLAFIVTLTFIFACEKKPTPQEAIGLSLEDSPVITNQLSNQRVTGFAEDADGYIWISTFRGLNRYNGHDFHQYYCNDDSTSLPDNQLNTVFKDSKDRIWVASVNGACYYTEQDNFHQVKMIKDASRNGTQFVENSKGKLFLNLVNSFVLFDEEKDAFCQEVKRYDPMDLYTMRLYIDKEDNLWSVCGWTIREYDSNTLEKKDSVMLDQFMPISCMQGKNIWMYGGGEFKIYDSEAKTFKPVPACITENALLQNSTVNYLHATENFINIYTPNGQFLYNIESETFIHQSDLGFPVQEREFFATTAFTDSKGNLWLGSQNQGFTIRSLQKRTFNSNSGLSALLANKSIPSVINDGNDNLWIATSHDGVYRYNTKTKGAQHFDLGVFFPKRKKGETDATSIYIDREGYIWMCISSMAIAKFQYKDGALTLVKEYGAFMPLTIYEDNNRNMWVGTYSDLLYYKPADEDEFKIQRVINKPFSYTSVIKELKDGTNIALSWEVGPQILNPNTLNINQAKINTEDMQLAMKRSLFLPTVLLEDSKNRIWIGTVANGLLCYHPDTGHIETMLGIPCTDICSMQEDNEGNIWISTMNGLSKYDTENGSFSTFYATDGLGGNQFFDRASCKLSDGTLIFGGTHGLTVFNPLETEKQEPIPLLFEDLKIHNKLILPEKGGSIESRLTKKPIINLNHNQNGFTISYTALDYSSDEQVSYHYMLEGFDNYWVDANESREAFYANVPPGKYTFKVKATNHGQDNVVGENQIQLSIAPAPWMTWWAKLFYLGLFIGIVYSFVRSYVRVQASKQETLQLEREKEHERHISEMNMSFFANVSHEFRTPLTIISGPIEQLCGDKTIDGENKHLLYIVQRSVRRMLRLVNQMMDFHKLEDDTLKLCVRQQDIIELLRQFADIFTINANEKNITFNVYGLEDKFIMWLDADKIEKITTNLLSNAFKFTPANGKITFSFDVISRQEASIQFPLKEKDKDSQYIKVTVKDTGKGLPAGEEEKVFGRYYQLERQQNENFQFGTGIGLYYAKKLVSLHHGYIKAENRKDQQIGAVFSYILPVNENSYTESERKSDETSQTVLFPLQNPEIEQIIEDTSDGRKRILVVDDDTEVVHYLKTMLSGDYHITSCFDAESGIKVMQEDAPDLVISDVLMPGTNGYEFCKQIKENIQLCHIPVILVTAKTTTENQIEGLNSGADAYVIKPFNPSYLKALIHSLLQNREKARHILVKSTQTAEFPQDVLSPQDKNFMDELYHIMEKELGNPELDVTHITELLHISRTKLYYKIKGLTGENPSVFFRCYKLNRAAELIKEGKYNLSEIADMTGFNTLSHFSTSFKKQFGVSPSDFK